MTNNEIDRELKKLVPEIFDGTEDAEDFSKGHQSLAEEIEGLPSGSLKITVSRRNKKTGSSREAIISGWNGDDLRVLLSSVRPAWVPVSERWPSGIRRCWVTVDDDSVDEPTTFEALWTGDEFVTNDTYTADIGSVSAWMEYFTPAPFSAPDKEIADEH